MIHYQLQCGQTHEFDGWFKDSAGFDRQAKRGLVECPVCGDTKVSRALMTPAVTKRGARPAFPPAPEPQAEPAPPPPPPPVSVGGRMPAHVFAMLRQLRSEVEKNCDYVGADFADEARKMHRGEVDPHGIYGETTPEEAESLADEGIEVSSLPWVPNSDS